jgi:hypothetical protein
MIEHQNKMITQAVEHTIGWTLLAASMSHDKKEIENFVKDEYQKKFVKKTD